MERLTDTWKEDKEMETKLRTDAERLKQTRRERNIFGATETDERKQRQTWTEMETDGGRDVGTLC